MLKRLLVNGKILPVPVPLHTAREAIAWLEEHILSADQVVTKATWDDAVLDLAGAELDRPIPSAVTLAVAVETPEELSYKLVDAIPNLIAVVSGDLKPAAVKLWEAEGVLPEGVLPLMADLHLIADLSEHGSRLSEDRDAAKVQAQVAAELTEAIVAFKKSLAGRRDGREAAKILLNRIEPCLRRIDTSLQGQKDRLDRACS